MARPSRRRFARSFLVSLGPETLEVDAGLVVADASAVSVGDGAGKADVIGLACCSRRDAPERTHVSSEGAGTARAGKNGGISAKKRQRIQARLFGSRSPSSAPHPLRSTLQGSRRTRPIPQGESSRAATEAPRRTRVTSLDRPRGGQRPGPRATNLSRGLVSDPPCPLPPSTPPGGCSYGPRAHSPPGLRAQRAGLRLPRPGQLREGPAGRPPARIRPSAGGVSPEEGTRPGQTKQGACSEMAEGRRMIRGRGDSRSTASARLLHPHRS